ncbi:MAG: hypothetical protein UU35_C0019G0014, partial [Candidatus Uhrbacteria bacterium GW2011_GWC2_41_11]
GRREPDLGLPGMLLRRADPPRHPVPVDGVRCPEPGPPQVLRARQGRDREPMALHERDGPAPLGEHGESDDLDVAEDPQRRRPDRGAVLQGRPRRRGARCNVPRRSRYLLRPGQDHPVRPGLRDARGDDRQGGDEQNGRLFISRHPRFRLQHHDPPVCEVAENPGGCEDECDGEDPVSDRDELFLCRGRYRSELCHRHDGPECLRSCRTADSTTSMGAQPGRAHGHDLDAVPGGYPLEIL